MLDHFQVLAFLAWLKAEIVFSMRGLQGKTLRMRGPIIILVLMVGILPLDIESVAS